MRSKTLIIVLVLLVGGVAWLFRPACVVIDAETVARFSPPIDTRDEQLFYGPKVFQKRGEQWFQCKTWISRQFFF